MPYMVGRARRRVAKLMRHTYTRVPHVDILDSVPPPAGDGLDAYGVPQMVAGTPVANVPCLYDDTEGQLLRRDDGTLAVATPALYVAHDDPLQVDDVVQNVSDGERVLIVSAVAELDTNAMPPGRRAFRIMKLREVVFP